MLYNSEKSGIFISFILGLIASNMDYINYLCTAELIRDFHIASDNQRPFRSLAHFISLRLFAISSLFRCELPTNMRLHFINIKMLLSFAFNRFFITGLAGSQSSLITSYCTRCIFHLLYGKCFRFSFFRP